MKKMLKQPQTKNIYLDDTIKNHYLNQSKTLDFDKTNQSKTLNSLLEDSALNPNDLSTSELDNVYKNFYYPDEKVLDTTKQVNNTQNNISHLNISRMNIREDAKKKADEEFCIKEVALLVLYLYNTSLSYDLKKRLKIFAISLCINPNNRIIEDGFDALCSFYKLQQESEENLTNGNFKIYEGITKSEKLYKWLCCTAKSTKAQEKRSFAKLVGYVHKKIEINYKIFKALSESQAVEDFAQLCQAINPNATIAEQTIKAVWQLCAEYKEKPGYIPMVELQNDKDFQILSSKLLGEVTMVNFIQTNKNYINVSNI